MNLFTLSLRNAFRNHTRAGLTLAGIAVLTFAFIFLRTVITSFIGDTSAMLEDRLVTRNRISLTFQLPMNYLDKIRAVPGVTVAAPANWFGGTYIDERNFFAKFAVEPDSYFKVYEKSIAVAPEDLRAFAADKTGCLIGGALAKKYNFTKGSVIRVKGDIYPGNWAFTVRGIAKAKDSFADMSLYFQHEYLDDSLPQIRRGYMGMVSLLIKDPAQSPQVVQAIDTLFANSAYETLTQSEKAFSLSFITGSEVIFGALQAISGVLLVIMLLILGNTLSMAVRERMSEIAVLRTIGFVPRQILWLSLGEGVWLGMIGGLLGILISNPILTVFAKAAGNFLALPNGNLWMAPAIAISVAMGLIAGAIPAVQASRINVVTALRRAE